jgi:hypothetical protein
MHSALEAKQHGGYVMCTVNRCCGAAAPTDSISPHKVKGVKCCNNGKPQAAFKGSAFDPRLRFPKTNKNKLTFQTNVACKVRM